MNSGTRCLAFACRFKRNGRSVYSIQPNSSVSIYNIAIVPPALLCHLHVHLIYISVHTFIRYVLYDAVCVLHSDAIRFDLLLVRQQHTSKSSHSYVTSLLTPVGQRIISCVSFSWRFFFSVDAICIYFRCTRRRYTVAHFPRIISILK